MNPDQVYPPREDTFLLARAAISEANESDFVLEVGTGSGYISRSLQESGIGVLATDINPHAVKAARSEGLEVVRADLFMGIRGPFDLVVFNPPYLPTCPEERIDDWLEYALDGGPDGRSVIRRFAEEVSGHLSPGGRVLILVSSVTGCEEVMALFRRQGFHVDIYSKERVYDEDLVVLKASMKTSVEKIGYFCAASKKNANIRRRWFRRPPHSLGTPVQRPVWDGRCIRVFQSRYAPADRTSFLPAVASCLYRCLGARLCVPRSIPVSALAGQARELPEDPE